MTETEVPERASRQEALAPYEKLRAARCVVVGAGAIGRTVALQLAAMGVAEITLFDHDTVGVENLAPQMYRPEDVGQSKVSVTGRDLTHLNPDVAVVRCPTRFAKSHWKDTRGAWVFSLADSMDARKNVWEACCKGGAAWFGDARAAGETVRVLAQKDPAAGGRYEKTLFRQEEAYQGSCTAKMTVFLAAVAGGFLVSKFAQHLRGVGQPYHDHTLNLLACELYEE
jgi:molybdopterin/thiamine biosynthesis adenylyltransferase